MGTYVRTTLVAAGIALVSNSSTPKTLVANVLITIGLLAGDRHG